MVNVREQLSENKTVGIPYILLNSSGETEVELLAEPLEVAP